MNQTPLTNMEGRWVYSTKEAYDALVEMGYMPMAPYDKKMKILEVYSSDNGISDPYSTCQLSSSDHISYESKQAFYQKGHFYDQPYEELTITEDKVPFPELEDIKMFTGPEWWLDALKLISYSSDDSRLNVYHFSKKAHENGVPVTWKLKEKINRKLHENRPLAMAIGRGLLEGIITTSHLNNLIGAVKINDGNNIVFHNCSGWVNKFTLPDDYIIPDKVLQWMKEYQEQGIK